VQAQNGCAKSFITYPEWGINFIPPEAPSEMKAKVGISNRVDVSWYNASDRTDGFAIERAPDAGAVPGDWVQIGTVDVNNAHGSYKFADTNVTGSTTNWYRVRAFNPLGYSDYTVAVRVELGPPPAPDFYAAAPFRDRVNLAWYEDYVGKVDG